MMAKKLLAAFLVLCLLSSLPSHAFFPGGPIMPSRGASGAGIVTLYAATCVSDTTNATTYTFTDVAVTGVTDGDEVLVVVGILSEDGLATFNVASATIEGNAATEVADEAGTGIVNTAFYQSSAPIMGAANVTVTVTHSEAVTSATVCIWALRGLSTYTATSSVVDDDTASGTLLLLLDPTTAGGYALGVCTNSGAASSALWAVLSEVEDTQDAEKDYSKASAETTGSSMSVGCDWSGTEDASGAAVAYR